MFETSLDRMMACSSGQVSSDSRVLITPCKLVSLGEASCSAHLLPHGLIHTQSSERISNVAYITPGVSLLRNNLLQQVRGMCKAKD